MGNQFLPPPKTVITQVARTDPSSANVSLFMSFDNWKTKFYKKNMVSLNYLWLKDWNSTNCNTNGKRLKYSRFCILQIKIRRKVNLVIRDRVEKATSLFSSFRWLLHIARFIEWVGLFRDICKGLKIVEKILTTTLLSFSV